MARYALIVMALVLAGCTTQAQLNERSLNAAAALAAAQANVPFPDLPEACVHETGRVGLKDEPWVMFKKRVDVVTDGRDRLARDCRAWGKDMKGRWARKEVR